MFFKHHEIMNIFWGSVQNVRKWTLSFCLQRINATIVGLQYQQLIQTTDRFLVSLPVKGFLLSCTLTQLWLWSSTINDRVTCPTFLKENAIYFFKKSQKTTVDEMLAWFLRKTKIIKKSNTIQVITFCFIST